MEIIENKYKDYVFPKKHTCDNCDSILLIERDDCEQRRPAEWYVERYEYVFTCPCCGSEQIIRSCF